MTDDLNVKESAVKEKRIWIRLNRVCNNGCLFCLDSDIHDGFMEEREVVEEKIRAGRSEGGQRLILSGGEASLHPDFTHFIEYGKAQGYSWVQTITNGRMYAYKKFAQRVIEAGLDEATFSMHGHTPELHDELVGVKSAFKQALTGMRNLVGRIVVNVDVVLNRLNIPHMTEILEFYMALGIHEFDLLHMMPFGRAWSENRERLFYDPAEMLPYLQSAFELRKRPGIYMWTNRLPAPFLEGNEDLIQDPHKIHDEVRGRREMFEAWRDNGTPPTCQGDRCPHCSMDGFCQALEQTLDDLNQPRFKSVTASADHTQFLDLWSPGRISEEIPVVFDARSTADLDCFFGQFSHRIPHTTLELPLPEMVLSHPQVSVFKGWRLFTLENVQPDLVETFVEGGGTVSLPLETGLGEWLVQLSEETRSRLAFHVVPRNFVSDARRLDPTLEELRKLSLKDVTQAPVCLSGQPVEPEQVRAVDLRLLDEEGKLDLVRFTDWYIEQRYHVKSLRCNGCVVQDKCRGLHINAARNYGFGALQPLEEE